jgi:NitT/TauT family transport system substrate-binding protein
VHVTQLTALDEGSTVDFPIQGYAVTQAWADKYPHTLAAFLRVLSQGQEIADTEPDRRGTRAGQVPADPEADRGLPLALPSFPTGVDPARLQGCAIWWGRNGLSI